MNIQVLGCSGGVGGQSGSTSILINNTVLLDAGSGLGDLSLRTMHGIEAVLLTHCHMDHICALPPFMANLFGYRDKPLPIYALHETIEVLKDCIFNWQIWPDFSVIPSEQSPIMKYAGIEPWQPLDINGLSITPFSVEHTVPTAGFSIQDEGEHFVFCADTKSSDVLIDQLNRLDPIDILMIECSFPDAYTELASSSGHLTPESLYATVQAIAQKPKDIWVTHLKPNYEAELRDVFANDSRFHGWRIL